jgi:hypothetical protein
MSLKKSAPKIEVTEYKMSIHMGICAGPVDSLLKIEIGEKEAWSGFETDNTILAIDEPDLHGGPKKEGGAVGDVAVLMGGDTQTIIDRFASKVDRTEATCPGFRGLVSLWFTGSTTGGFSWSHNTPYLKPVRATVRRTSLDWLPDYAAVPRDTKSRGTTTSVRD